MKTCMMCGAEIPNRRVYCEKCVEEKQRLRAKNYKNRLKDYTSPPKPCTICGAPLQKLNQFYCSDECKRIAERRRNEERYAQPGGYAISQPGPGWLIREEHGSENETGRVYLSVCTFDSVRGLHQ